MAAAAAAATSSSTSSSQNLISSRISEGTFRPPGACYCDWFCVLFGTKLGGVLPFRVCFEKGVWLLVSFFRGWLIAAAAAASSSSSHQQQPPAAACQNLISSRISEGTFRPPGSLLLRLISRPFRQEIRWCFAVSGVFRKRCLAVGFL